MTREEITAIVKNEGHSLTFTTYSNAFSKEIVNRIYIPIIDWGTGEHEQDLDKLVTDYVTDCINSFIRLDKTKFIDKLKDEVFKLFNRYIEATSYSQVPDNLIEKHGNTKANRLFFNGATKDSVYSTCNFHEVYYTQDSGPKLRFSILTKLDWEMEHGLTLFFENSELVNIE
ncbi:MAG TPA: hypothetical protein VGQ09_22395 [Chitinophagaceae bacterium]|jgi:hypothetical protein|nr:hypothetical protein [Chitinophagaceae bacterium]